jgi:hypothetical protein
MRVSASPCQKWYKHLCQYWVLPGIPGNVAGSSPVPQGTHWERGMRGRSRKAADEAIREMLRPSADAASRRVVARRSGAKAVAALGRGENGPAHVVIRGLPRPSAAFRPFRVPEMFALDAARCRPASPEIPEEPSIGMGLARVTTQAW